MLVLAGLLSFGDKDWNLSYFEGVWSVGTDLGRLFPLVLGLTQLENNLGMTPG